MPESIPNFSSLFCEEIVDCCLYFLRDDVLYHNVIDDVDTFVEVNLSQMISYSIYKGVAAKDMALH